MLLAGCVNTPIDHNVFLNLHAPVVCCEVLRVLCERGLRGRVQGWGGGINASTTMATGTTFHNDDNHFRKNSGCNGFGFGSNIPHSFC